MAFPRRLIDNNENKDYPVYWPRSNGDNIGQYAIMTSNAELLTN